MYIITFFTIWAILYVFIEMRGEYTQISFIQKGLR